MTRPTERTDWATEGDGSGGANAIRTATDSSRWTLGWQATPGNLPGEQGEKPNLNEQNYWQYAVHKWFQYLEGQQGLASGWQAVRNTSQVTSPSTSGYFSRCTYYSKFLDMFFLFYGGQAINYRSPDGLNFYASSVDTNALWNAAAESASLIAVVGENGAIQTSPDGTTWTARTHPDGSGVGGADMHAVTYGNGLFVVVSGNKNSNNVVTSADGITWSYAATLPGTTTLAYDVIWSEYHQLFFAGGYTGGSTNNNIWTSPDGTTWTARDSLNLEVRYLAVDEVSGRVVGLNSITIAGSDPVVYSDDAGVTWTAGTYDKRGSSINDLDIGIPSYSPAYKLWIAISGSGHLSLSENGIDWFYYGDPGFNINLGAKSYAYSDKHKLWWVGDNIDGGTITRTL